MSLLGAPGANGSAPPDCEGFQLALLPSVYGVEFCVALVGNLLALWLLASRGRRSWHTGVVLSCNLAVSDLLYALTLPLLIAYYKMDKHWPFGDAMCKVDRFLFACNLYASIFFVMCISVNRCVALAYPFFTRSHVSPARVGAVAVAVWAAVAALCSPVLAFASTCAAPDSKKTECVAHCGRDDGHAHLLYVVSRGVLGCLLPFAVTFASYCVVVRVVWRNAHISRPEKQKVALMVASVVVLYAVSFVPYHVFQSYHLYLKVHYPGAFVCWVYKAYQVSKALATLNMCLHPVLYMAVLDSIRVVVCGRKPRDRKKGLKPQDRL